MAVKFGIERFGNQREYLYNVAQTTKYFDQQLFSTLQTEEEQDQYIQTIAWHTRY